MSQTDLTWKEVFRCPINTNESIYVFDVLIFSYCIFEYKKDNSNLYTHPFLLFAFSTTGGMKVSLF